MPRNRVETIFVDWLAEAADSIRAGRWQAAAHTLERTLHSLRSCRQSTSISQRTTPGVELRPAALPAPPCDWNVRQSMNCSRCGSAPGAWHEEACLGTEY
jgi:hypothetical protein